MSKHWSTYQHMCNFLITKSNSNSMFNEVIRKKISLKKNLKKNHSQLGLIFQSRDLNHEIEITS
jgi:ABC-type phosphate/phosphonate transport system ATPase subunit